MTLEEKRRFLASAPAGATQVPVVDDKRDMATKVLENIATGGYDAANSVLLGLPDFLMRLNPESKKAIEDLRARNKEASQVGEIGGLVGSMFIPGGAILKGAGGLAKLAGATKAAEALGKGAQFLKSGELVGNIGQKIGTAALRGAGQAAEQAIPRALLAEDVGQGLESLPLSIGVGAAGGALLGPLAQKFLTTPASKVIKEGAEEFVDKAKAATVGAMGIDRKAVMSALNKSLPGGTRASNRVLSGTKKLIDDVAEIGSKPEYNFLKEVGREDRVEAGLRAISKKYETAIDDAMMDPTVQSKAYNAIFDDIDELEKLDIVKFDPKNNPYTNTAGLIDDYLRKPGGPSSLRNRMQERASTLMKKNNRTDYEEAELKSLIAGRAALDDVLDEVSSAAGGPGLKELGREYRVLKAVKDGEFRNMLKDISPISMGSMTAEKTAIQKLISGQNITQAAAGAGLTGAATAQDFESDPLGTAAKVIGGGLGGVAVGKYLPKLIQHSMAAATKPAERIAGKLAGMNLSALDDVSLPKAASIIAQQEKLNKDPASTVEQQEQAMPPEQVEQARQGFSQKFAGVMNQRLQSVYKKYYSDLDPKDFLARVSEKTGNFTDIKAMAPVLYPDKKQRDDFLRKYDAYLALKNIDINKAVKGGGFLGLDQEAQKANELLTQKLIELQSEGDMGKRETAKKQVEKYIADVRKSPELLDQFIRETGLDFADLEQLGLTGA